ncbi:MAG: DNA-binding response regulator [Anaerolineaceae bacterium]|nr:MAG: DNA-binding response regulator [Anaerolineaceae bacterium]
MSDTILIVDDEQHIVELAKSYLENAGYKCETSANGRDALDRILRNDYMLIVLDLMLPEMKGFDVCRQVREQSDVPIIMLTARTDDADKIAGLEMGADDYLTKPFNPKELVARVRAILRRVPLPDPDSDESEVVSIGNLHIDPSRRTIKIDDHPVNLRMKEFDLLLTLAREKGHVFSREKLLQLVWGYEFFGETRTVDVHIAHLRQKLESMKPTIETVWGIGYKLEFDS